MTTMTKTQHAHKKNTTTNLTVAHIDGLVSNSKSVWMMMMMVVKMTVRRKTLRRRMKKKKKKMVCIVHNDAVNNCYDDNAQVPLFLHVSLH